jgi:lysophospholipase L1-like esterase
MGPAGALITLCCATLLTLVAALRSAPAATGALMAMAATGGATATSLVAAEFYLARPSVAERIGTPIARRRWDRHYDSLWTRNLFQFRTRHEHVRRPPGVVRILALGDSFTWGDKVADSDSTWPARLEVELSGRGQVEVLNLGQRGWTTYNEGELLRRLGWQLDPQLVVWQFYVNDVYESRPHFIHDTDAWPRFLPAILRRGHVDSSAVLYLLERAIFASPGRWDPYESYAYLYEPKAAGWLQLDSTLREAGQRSPEYGVPIVLVLWPALLAGTWTDSTYPLAPLHRQVQQAAVTAGLHVIDLTSHFSSDSGDWNRWWALPWDTHPNSMAHARAASIIAHYIVDSTSLGEAFGHQARRGHRLPRRRRTSVRTA